MTFRIERRSRIGREVSTSNARHLAECAKRAKCFIPRDEPMINVMKSCLYPALIAKPLFSSRSGGAWNPGAPDGGSRLRVCQDFFSIFR